ncbi:MAG: SPOR domain-containing protein, partial [Alloalcanivorax venustensis]
LKGYQARIQPVDMDNGDTWHRVMIGPYDNINTLHRAQDKLAANGVETLPIQLKD